MGGTLFFTADDGIHGRELWKSDGTKAGTVLVKDIDPSADDGEPSSLTGVGGTLFFTADDGINGRELWRSDGTRAGTVLVKDINPTPRQRPSSLTGVGGRCSSPPTTAPTAGSCGSRMAPRRAPSWSRTSTPTPTTATPSSLTDVGGTLFFTADDGTHGRELWKSDGTRAGTVLVKDIHPGDYDSEPLLPDRCGRDVVLHRQTTAPTVGSCGSRTAPGRARSWSRTSTPAPRDSDPSSLTGVGGTLFFTADDGTHGGELWKSDGTRAGTVLVKDIHPGADDASRPP